MLNLINKRRILGLHCCCFFSSNFQFSKNDISYLCISHNFNTQYHQKDGLRSSPITTLPFEAIRQEQLILCNFWLLKIIEDKNFLPKFLWYFRTRFFSYFSFLKLFHCLLISCCFSLNENIIFKEKHFI